MRFAWTAVIVVSISIVGARAFQASDDVGARGFQPSGPARLKGSPSYSVDPYWPKALPNHWLVGAVAGIAVDARDHIWITHRPSTLQPNETRSIWKAAPPVLEFDQDGTLVQSWGGPGAGYEWPQLEHGIYVDAQDHVWLGGGGDKEAKISSSRATASSCCRSAIRERAAAATTPRISAARRRWSS